MTDEEDTLLQFPCDFPIKILGVASEHYLEDIKKIIKKHFPDIEDANFQCKESSKGNYLAITVTVLAKSKASLDDLYRELTVYPGIKMVL